MSLSSGPMSSSTFLRFVRGPLEEGMPEERLLRPSFGVVGAHECRGKSSVPPKGSRSAVENLSDSEGRVSHSLMAPVARAAVAGTRGGVGK
jgi:hypothetical protein